MNDFIILIVGIIFHEAAHYIHFRDLGFKSSVIFTGYWVEVKPNSNDITLIQLFINKIFAVLVGCIIVSACVNNVFFFAYWVSCFFDLNGILLILDFVSKKKMKWSDKYSDIKLFIKGKEVIE